MTELSLPYPVDFARVRFFGGWPALAHMVGIHGLANLKQPTKKDSRVYR